MVTWYERPEFKLEIGTTPVTWTNGQGLNLLITLPENAVSNAIIIANDSEAINYLANVNNLDLLKAYLRYSDQGSAWTQVFQGEIESIQPQIDLSGEVLVATARGSGFPLVDMNVFTDYGVESGNPTIDTVQEIIDHIIDNYVEKSFGGGSSGHSMPTLIDSSSPSWNASLNYIPFPFKSAIDALKYLCDFGSAVAGPTDAGPHFYITPAGKLCVATVGSHQTPAFDSDWPTWWNTNQAGSTLVQGIDFKNFTFQDDAKNYYNHIIYAGSLLKPGIGDYCENNSADWDMSATGAGPPTATASDEGPSTIYKVGSYSIKANATGGSPGGDLRSRYKKNTTWVYDLTKWGGKIAHPTFSFWLRRDAGIGTFYIRLIGSSSSIYADIQNITLPTINQWYGFNFEIGPYGHIRDSADEDYFYSGGFNWTNFSYIWFFGDIVSLPCNYWIDGLNFQGQIIRAAKDSTKITNDDERQLYIFDSVGKDDTTKSGTPGTTDTGYMARIAKAELLRASKKPLEGKISIPLAPSLLPGQLIHIHAKKKANGTFSIDGTFRVVEVQHSFAVQQGGQTTVNVTNDVKNSLTTKIYSKANLIINQMLGKDRESLNLKSMGIDLTTPILTETYTT